MYLKPIIRGLLGYLPGVLPLFNKGRDSKGTGGSVSARYCYSVWLRHLVHLYDAGMKETPSSVLEIGPGDSLGVGFMALLTGADRYVALDSIQHADSSRNVQVFDELLGLLKDKTSIPGSPEFADLKPALDCYDFPGHILTDALLDKCLNSNRVACIRSAVISGSSREDNAEISYTDSWAGVAKDSVGLIFSQAVMEHIEDLEMYYSQMFSVLKPGGFMSHEVDFKAHETHKQWYGHYCYSDFAWKIIMRGRSYSINRTVLTEHRRLMIQSGFKILATVPVVHEKRFPHNTLNVKYRMVPMDDLSVMSCYVLARKP